MHNFTCCLYLKNTFPLKTHLHLKLEITLKCKIYLKICKAVKKDQSHNISVAIFSNLLENNAPYENTSKPVHHYKCILPFFIYVLKSMNRGILL